VRPGDNASAASAADEFAVIVLTPANFLRRHRRANRIRNSLQRPASRWRSESLGNGERRHRQLFRRHVRPRKRSSAMPMPPCTTPKRRARTTFRCYIRRNIECARHGEGGPRRRAAACPKGVTNSSCTNQPKMHIDSGETDKRRSVDPAGTVRTRSRFTGLFVPASRNWA